jgi:ribose 1,5-bisphosphokinase
MKMSGLAPLVLIVGPSGAGKDTLLEGASRVLAPTGQFYFSGREITRPVSAEGEQHTEISRTEFNQKEAEGKFLLSWRAHGNCYGVPNTPSEEIRRIGKTVVASVSRSVIDDANARHQPVHVIYVTAPKSQLAKRLALRGRETEPEILERLNRAGELEVSGKNVTVITNDQDIETGISKMITALQNASILEWEPAE